MTGKSFLSVILCKFAAQPADHRKTLDEPHHVAVVQSLRADLTPYNAAEQRPTRNARKIHPDF